ncbi:New1 protein [Saccharomycopsis crataegensis]|uniref:New1 protein n=1 Tax=Saccharomycopsis crataegensis TaxID=43959 RepID=A0AAV5QQ97_9ASCO|nr:New1 protein [Saccharomycopsis crataegensis]
MAAGQGQGQKKKFEKFDPNGAQSFTPGQPQQQYGVNGGYYNNNGYRPNNNQGNSGFNNSFHQKKPMSYQQFQTANQPRKNHTDSVNSSDFDSSSEQSSRLTTPTQSTTSLTALNHSMQKLHVSPLSECLENFKNSKNLADIRKNSGDISDKIVEHGLPSIDEWELYDFIKLLTTSKSSSALLKEGAMILLQTLVSSAFIDKQPYEAYLIKFFPLCLNQFMAKEINVVKAAQKTVDVLYTCIPSVSSPSVLLNELLAYLQSSAKWKPKVGALKIINNIIEDASAEVLKMKFHVSIPILSDISSDFKPELAKEGFKTLTNFVNVLEDNLDLEKNLPAIVAALNDPKKITACINSLASTTFVTEVTEATLAILAPTLNKSMNMASSSQDQLRLTITIVENLTRLVKNYKEIENYLPILLPSVKKIAQNATLPEIRELASKSLKVLETADEYTKKHEFNGVLSLEEAKKYLGEQFKSNSIIQNYVANIVADLSNVHKLEELKHYLEAILNVKSDAKLLEFATEEEKEKYIATMIHSLKELFHIEDEEDIYEDEGEEIVNTIFSLAYGGRMLLNKTRLRLVKGHRYGLCGRNGAGKSTLMRAIDNGQVDGFPSKDQLKTCFVEHKVPTEDEKSTKLDLVSLIQTEEDFTNLPREEIAKALEDVGFDETRRSQALNSLSGGWRMKLALAKAMLMKADILLLDEPTNHLDVANVAWLADYLLEHSEITSLIVSHDSGFLDKVCTNIIHYESKKLVYYKGNLSALVKIKPETKSYYTLTDSNAKMAFPRCGLLQGIKSRTKAIAKMVDVTFTYPGAPKPSLSDVSCSLSLSSRVAVLGPNGAGKSTLIKLLTAELVPDKGTVEKHPNLRIGYIAQHALQHVEQHKEKTANQYLQWRYKFGDDREVLLKESRKISDEEKEIMKKEIEVDDGRGPRQIEAIVGRQKFKKSFQYEVKWKFWLPRYNSWVPKEVLLEHGFNKLVQKFDDHEASREGLGYRQLIPSVIRQHFEDVGLDGEIADHTPMGSLSGGQLVKVVIAGAMWNNPHLLVLDEPTNYLDRDSLGALAIAIRDWNGGVVMISHNNEFTGALCPEQWIVENGKMVTKTIASIDEDRFEDGKHGEVANKVMASGEAASYQKPDDDDSPANIKVKKRKKKLTRNEKKARDERRRLRHIEWLSSPKGTPKPQDTDDEDE